MMVLGNFGSEMVCVIRRTVVVVAWIGLGLRHRSFPVISIWVNYHSFRRLFHPQPLPVVLTTSQLMIVFYSLVLFFLHHVTSLCFRLFKRVCVGGYQSIICLRSQGSQRLSNVPAVGYFPAYAAEVGGEGNSDL